VANFTQRTSHVLPLQWKLSRATFCRSKRRWLVRGRLWRNETRSVKPQFVEVTKLRERQFRRDPNLRERSPSQILRLAKRCRKCQPLGHRAGLTPLLAPHGRAGEVTTFQPPPFLAARTASISAKILSCGCSRRCLPMAGLLTPSVDRSCIAHDLPPFLWIGG
jgi:hypothetical protein